VGRAGILYEASAVKDCVSVLVVFPNEVFFAVFFLVAIAAISIAPWLDARRR
jgi:hypothetical protein